MNVMNALGADARQVPPSVISSKPDAADMLSRHVERGVLDYDDPLDADALSDATVSTTRRAISRVALVATEAASRFQREGLAHDPMTWMLAPRSLFGGASALDACLDRDACLRGVLLHGLSLGLDADPAFLDELMDEDDDDDDLLLDFSGVEFERRESDARAAAVDIGRPDVPRVGSGDGETPPIGGDTRDPEPRLFTATVVADDGVETIQAFHASFALDEAEIAGRLYMRMGAASAEASIIRGFDQTSPIVEALVSSALCDTLMMIAANPGSPLGAGLDLNIEQRFLA